MQLLFIIKTLFLYCLCDLSKSLELQENRAEYVKWDDNKNDSSMWNGLTELLQEQPIAVLVELREPLLQKVREILEEDSPTNFPLKSTLLGTFNSLGLRDVSVHNDTLEIRQAIMSLEASPNDGRNFTPTFHVLGEMLEKELSDGSILLITMSKPSDEDFGQYLMRSFLRKKIQLSVFWTEKNSSDEYKILKKLTEETGGKFRYIMNESNSDENLTESYFPKAEFENFSQQIKFPENEKPNTDDEGPMVSKTANQRVLQKAVVPLIVEVASGTSLEARPGTVTQIPFNVKNNINVPIPVIFRAKYNGIIQNVQPPQALLPPSTSINVIVNLQPIGAAQSVNAIGTLTLFADAANKVTPRSALISLTPQVTTDNNAPKIYHKYEGDCSNYKEPQNCEQGHWTLEATLHDEESGLLKVLSEPYGLLFQSEFVAGMKSPVTVYYSATCCQPNAIIWAEDLKGNYVRKTFDVFNQNLLAGEIASIVLGVLLIILIIMSIIIGVIMYKRRNQRNLIIPSVRSSNS